MFGSKKNSEYNEYEDEGNFSYNEDLKTNEFNDATIEYGDGEEIEEEFYVEDPHEINKNKIMFFALLGGLIILIIVILLIRGCVGNGKVNSVKITSPDIIYVGDKEKIIAKAQGRGNLKNTIYKFEVSDESIVGLDNKDIIKGKTAVNYLTPIATGKFILGVSGQLEDVKLPNAEKEIVICRRLSEESFNNSELTAVINKPIKLNIDLGEDTKCFENLTYKIKDNSIVKIDENRNLVGLKKGSTTITFESDGKSVTKIVNVSKDGKNVTGLTLNKDKVTLEIGKSEQIKAAIKPSDATNKNIKWESTNTGIVKVSSTGKLTGVGKGSAIVTATTEDGGYKRLINVTVKAGTGGGSQGGSSKDTTAPKLTTVTIYSNNTYKQYASLVNKSNEVTIEMVSNEPLKSSPVVSVNGSIPLKVTCNGTICKAVLTVSNSIPDGKLSFKISSYKDAAGNTGAVVTTTTDSSSVLIDKTKPECKKSSAGTTDTEQKYKFTWSDPDFKIGKGSGVSSVIKPDGKSENGSQVGRDVSGSQTFTFKREKYAAVKTMKVTDWAGNITECSVTVAKKETEDVTPTPTPTKKTYYATFIASTGIRSIGSSKLSCETDGVSNKCTVTAPTITPKSLYQTIGWCSSETCTKAEYAVGAKIELDSNETFYAVAKYKYSGGGGSSDDDDDDDDGGGIDGGDEETCTGRVPCSASDTGAICSSYTSWSCGSWGKSSSDSSYEGELRRVQCELVQLGSAKNDLEYQCRTCTRKYTDCTCPCS